jgi:hypothetical protein
MCTLILLRALVDWWRLCRWVVRLLLFWLREMNRLLLWLLFDQGKKEGGNVEKCFDIYVEFCGEASKELDENESNINCRRKWLLLFVIAKLMMLDTVLLVVAAAALEIVR